MKAKDYVARAESSMRHRWWSRAVTDYTRAIELDPSLAEAYCGRGYAHRKMGLWKEAIADYTKAIELDPNYAEAYYLRGNVYLRWFVGAERAIAEYTKAIELNPNFADAYFARGLARLLKASQNRANTSELLQRKTDFQRHYFQALKSCARGRSDLAYADFVRAIELDPVYAGSYWETGLNFFEFYEVPEGFPEREPQQEEQEQQD